jgi:hypothetical protein
MTNSEFKRDETDKFFYCQQCGGYGIPMDEKFQRPCWNTPYIASEKDIEQVKRAIYNWEDVTTHDKIVESLQKNDGDIVNAVVAISW